ncbi:uncharacterized protein B0J16DRAFT_346129 [Fusarium flagelliforme]|uniref:uncharacterized protein n=1 Tax=Fusarium flagelliforme TaxID=2675880 RepID=UPI001E8D1C7B|nr:uncharacterized protein B0J16DRAFT_346129 [Fusarium flagelliforme]KAH7178963.1 hypothetical protein B0J16DRAFT_346129 [Fusarium flagelliforme]
MSSFEGHKLHWQILATCVSLHLLRATVTTQSQYHLFPRQQSIASTILHPPLPIRPVYPTPLKSHFPLIQSQSPDFNCHTIVNIYTGREVTQHSRVQVKFW